MKRFLVLIVLFSIIAFSCKNSLPSGILKPEKMQLVLWDIMRAEVLTENFISRDTLKNKISENVKLQKQVFLINNVTREEFYNSLKYYEKKPAVFNVMLDTLTARMYRDRDKMVKSNTDTAAVKTRGWLKPAPVAIFPDSVK
jgi:hypothetical protein